MKTRLLLSIAAIVIGLVSPTFAQDTVDPQVAEQVRALASKYDRVFSRNDVTALGALFSEDAVFSGPHGRFNGRQAMENFHSQQVFGRWHVNNRVTTVDPVVSVSDEVSSSGRWSETVQSNGKNVGATYSWVLIRDGDSWKIRMATYSEQN
jgi:ketosteroid isomerase-like protein